MSVLKQYRQPVVQKELALQMMSKASSTVPDSGEMLHEAALWSAGVSVVTEFTAGSVCSGPGIGRVYLAKPVSFFPIITKTHFKINI